jgi:pimeloyl-ACP methyl ester carboxylesterase
VTAVANAFAEAHLQADEHRIRYRHGGTGQPLVYLHGGGGLHLNRAHELLAAVTVPTLVVVGTRDNLTPPELGRVYRAKMPNCNYVLVYDAGHDVAADRPEAFSSLVGDFLERREAFIVSQKSSLLHP